MTTLTASRPGHSSTSYKPAHQAPVAHHSINQTRPRSLQELASQAKDEIAWDPNLKVTHWLHKAEEFREKALNADKNSDVETTWIELIKSTDILHRLKEHTGYRTYFTESQRSTMTKNFDIMIARMYQLKPVVVNRYESWSKQHPIQETSEDERKKEEDRRLEYEAQQRKQIREEMAKQAELDRLRRQEEAARKEREAREAREEQLRKHAEAENRYRQHQQQNQQPRERAQENKPAAKYSKASDSANAALQEAEKERERRKLTRLEVERRESQSQQLASTPTTSAFPSSSRDVRGQSSGPPSAQPYPSAPKPDDDVILVGTDGQRHARQRSRQSSLMDRSPNSISAQPSSGSEHYLSVSPGVTVSMNRNSHSPSSGSASGVSPNMTTSQSQNARRGSLGPSATMPPSSFPQSFSHSESVRRDASAMAHSKGITGYSNTGSSAYAEQRTVGPPAQPLALRRESTAPASNAQTSVPSNRQSVSQTAPARQPYRQPGLILEDLSNKQAPSATSRGDLSTIQESGRAEENRQETSDRHKPQTVAARAAAGVPRSQTLPVGSDTMPQNGHYRNGGDESIHSTSATLGSTPSHQTSISRQNSISVSRDDETPYKQRHSSVSRAQTMPASTDSALTGFIPPPPANLDFSAAPATNPRSRQTAMPAKVETSNLLRSFTQGQGATPQNSSTPTSYMTRYGVSTGVSEATATPLTSVTTSYGPTALNDQESPNPFKESKLASQYNLPKPPQPYSLTASDSDPRNKGKGADRSFTEPPYQQAVTASGVSRGGMRSRDPSPSKDDRARDRMSHGAAGPGLAYGFDSSYAENDPNYLGASNTRPALSRRSSSSQESKAKTKGPHEEEINRSMQIGRHGRQSSLEGVEDHLTPSGTHVGRLQSSAQYRAEHSGSGSDSDYRRRLAIGSTPGHQQRSSGEYETAWSSRPQYLKPPEEYSTGRSPQGSHYSSSPNHRHPSEPAPSANTEVVSVRSLEKRPAEPEPIRRKPKLLSEVGSDRSAGEDEYPTLSGGEFASRPPSAGVTYDSVSESGAPQSRHVELPTVHPLQSPRRWAGDDSSTDEHGRKLPPLPRDAWSKRNLKKAEDERETASIQGPPPMTTTSPRPNEFPKTVPAQMLMSSHQLAQGYTPSLSSMVSNSQMHPPIEQSTLLANRAFQFSEKNLMPQNPYPRRPGKPSQMPVQLMDPRSQAEAARVRHFDARKDRQMQNLKPVDVPKDILKRFMALAAENTELKKETLGLLLGKIRHEKYIVTTLLIPNQSGGEDWCAMENDDMIVQFQERRFLVTLGWIHTHPTQTCFMSSCDLHTHAPYQQMLPEAFAIVCSPRFKPNFGVFRLTDPPGLRHVLDCKKPEMFHQHDAPNLYTDCDSAHVSLIDGIGLEICDIRKHREIS